MVDFTPSVELDAGLLAELRRLEIRTRRSVDSDLLGNYRSAFRGTGLSFSDLREYQPGVDVRHIHWKATARSKVAYVKNYQEERQLRMLLVLDVSNSMRFGSPRSKYRRGVEFCALLSTLAYKSGDLFGLALFGSEVEFYLRPSGGRPQLHRTFLAFAKQESPQATSTTSLESLLQHLITHQKQSSLIFIISDFLSDQFDGPLAVLAARHDVVLVHMRDLLDLNLQQGAEETKRESPKWLGPLSRLLQPSAAGLVRFTDLETGQQRVVDTSSSRVMRALRAAEERRVDSLNARARKASADIIHVRDSALRPLQQLMSMRARRY